MVSETRNGDVFTSASIGGPWRKLGRTAVDQTAFRSVKTPGDIQNTAEPKPWRASNVSLIARAGGGYQIIRRSGQILLSTTGVLGPYTVMGDSIYRNLPGLPQRDMRAYEDPVIWRSGGWYHVVVNHWRERRAFHLISRDGTANWRLQGLAYEPGAGFIRYADGQVNRWSKLERPGVLIENGHVRALTFSVVDILKEQQTGGNGHGSKVIVVPFDGAAMDRDLADIDRAPAPAAGTASEGHPSIGPSRCACPPAPGPPARACRRWRPPRHRAGSPRTPVHGLEWDSGGERADAA